MLKREIKTNLLICSWRVSLHSTRIRTFQRIEVMSRSGMIMLDNITS